MKTKKQKILDAVAPSKRGKWIVAAMRPWTGEVMAAKFEELRSDVWQRGNRAVDDAALAGYDVGYNDGYAVGYALAKIDAIEEEGK